MRKNVAILALLGVVAFLSFRTTKVTTDFQLNVGSTAYHINDGSKEIYSIPVGAYPALDQAIAKYQETGEVPSLPSPDAPRKRF